MWNLSLERSLSTDKCDLSDGILICLLPTVSNDGSHIDGVIVAYVMKEQCRNLLILPQ